MSGGGGGGGPPAGPPTGGPVPCDQLRFDTQLANPQPATFPTLQHGQVLQVAIEDLNGSLVITTRDDHGTFVGAITSRVPDLMRCLRQHVPFEAEITYLATPVIEVNVRPA
jgi:hypothetical protein